MRDLANKGKIFSLEKKKEKAASDDDSCFIIFYLGLALETYSRICKVMAEYFLH